MFQPGRRQEGIRLPGTDFSSSVYALSGQWEFYYGRLYTLWISATDSQWMEYINLPGPWIKLGYPKLGYGTYRLKVLTEPTAIPFIS